jgi:hypothetical protein
VTAAALANSVVSSRAAQTERAKLKTGKTVLVNGDAAAGRRCRTQSP